MISALEGVDGYEIPGEIVHAKRSRAASTNFVHAFFALVHTCVHAFLHLRPQTFGGRARSLLWRPRAPFTLIVRGVHAHGSGVHALCPRHLGRPVPETDVGSARARA